MCRIVVVVPAWAEHEQLDSSSELSSSASLDASLNPSHTVLARGLEAAVWVLDRMPAIKE